MCVRVLRGTVLLIFYVRARACVCVKKGGVKEDSHFWFGLRRVTGTWSSSGMLYWNNLLWPQTGAHRLSACLLMTCSLLLFHYLFFTFAVKFHRRMKSFFILLCDILKAGFSFCSLGETANALDETQKSLARSLYGWLFDKFILPCLPFLHQIYTVYLKKVMI